MRTVQLVRERIDSLDEGVWTVFWECKVGVVLVVVTYGAVP